MTGINPHDNSLITECFDGAAQVPSSATFPRICHRPFRSVPILNACLSNPTVRSTNRCTSVGKRPLRTARYFLRGSCHTSTECYTEKAPNAWQRRGTQKTRNTYNQPNRPNRQTSQTKHQALPSTECSFTHKKNVSPVHLVSGIGVGHGQGGLCPAVVHVYVGSPGGLGAGFVLCTCTFSNSSVAPFLFCAPACMACH